MNEELLPHLEGLLKRQGENYQKNVEAVTQQAIAYDHLATELREFRQTLDRMVATMNGFSLAVSSCQAHNEGVGVKITEVMNQRQEQREEAQERRRVTLTLWEKAYVPLLLALAGLLGSIVTYVLQHWGGK